MIVNSFFYVQIVIVLIWLLQGAVTLWMLIFVIHIDYAFLRVLKFNLEG